MNEEKEPITNFEGKPTLDHQVILTIITIVTLILSVYGKMLTMGWITVMLIFSMILPLHFVLFTKTGMKFARCQNKTKGSYIYFFALCITMILYAFAFVDVGDIGTSKAIDFIEVDTLSNISSISFYINIVLIFIISRKVKNNR